MNRRLSSRLKTPPPLFSGPRFSLDRLDSRSGALSTSPLVQGILPENLRFPAGGGTAVVLWNQWRPMLEELRQVGRLLLVTRNPHAVIGCYEDYPALEFSEEGGYATDGAGFAVDLGRWRQAVAVEDRMPDGVGVRYAVEIVDAAREPLHKICLTPDSDLPRFLEWVQVHQAAGLDPLPPFRPPAPSVVPAASPVGAAFAALLDALLEHEMEVRVTVGNDGVSQAGFFTFREMRRIGEWIFCSDGEAGWHVRPAAIDRLLLERCTCAGACPVRLRAVCAEGNTLFLLAPGASADAAAWAWLAQAAASEIP